MPPSCITETPDISPRAIATFTAGVTTLSRPLGFSISAITATVDPAPIIMESFS